MNDGDYEVDILDEQGNRVGSKLRKDIVKGKDIYHAVYGTVVTPDGRICLNKIAHRQDMPNLHAGSFGCSAATIKRSGETGDQAMRRAVKNELKTDIEPQLIKEDFIAVDGTFRKIGIYQINSEVPETYNHEDIEEIIPVTKEEFRQIIETSPEKITPVLNLFWNFLNSHA